jgi:hypothetical protein
MNLMLKKELDGLFVKKIKTATGSLAYTKYQLRRPFLESVLGGQLLSYRL